MTSAEWLDVNYGSLVRELLVQHLGVKGIHVIEPTALPFEDAATTAVITNFFVGLSNHPMSNYSVSSQQSSLLTCQQTSMVRRERLEAAPRWTPLTRTAREWHGRFCRTGRTVPGTSIGQVTGMNDVWIIGSDADELPESVLFPSVTKAREPVIRLAVRSQTCRLCVTSLTCLSATTIIYDGVERKSIDRFLRAARQKGAHKSYTATHRKAWYSIGLH